MMEYAWMTSMDEGTPEQLQRWSTLRQPRMPYLFSGVHPCNSKGGVRTNNSKAVSGVRLINSKVGVRSNNSEN